MLRIADLYTKGCHYAVPILKYMKYVTHKYGDVQKASNISLFELTIPIKSVGKDKGVLTGSIVHS